MNKTLSNVILIALIALVLANCANRGNPDGGPKDVTPPQIIKSLPENFTTNFKGDEIKIYFDEYIKIKDLQKQLIISPPMETQPEVSPLGGASKFITIKIKDTLKPNTTYAFNFGNSITDNNEGNPYPYYRYVFSTGDYIDSLSVKGNIIDALLPQPETFVNVGLYEVDSTFNDSIVYNKVPTYITNTLDSVTTFNIENIKAGKYLLVALKDNNGDNKFQQKTDQIGYYDHIITVPTDSSYTIKLFSETLDFRPSRPFLAAQQKIAFGYEGPVEAMDINLISEVPEAFEHRITKEENKDTLNYWYKPKIEVDSLLFVVTHPDVSKDYKVRIRPQDVDSLIIKSISPNNISEPFKVKGNIPFVNLDKSKVTLMDKDSVKVAFTTKLDSLKNEYVFDFKKTEDNSYNIKILPEAFTDFFDNKNADTLVYSVRTKKSSDFGYVRFNLVNAKLPIIIQLTTEKGEVKFEHTVTKEGPIDFENLPSGKYNVRVIHDANGNGIFDTGSYINKSQPERVSHFKLSDDVRADWGNIETLIFNED
ncbi:Ig-like domain-containing protein [Aestuariibaculum sediminum]|uniref:Ig-like domain-containing protein n=1 Tax=Aestuariibaculum sediminum TaxID=2770637 RepID=A0A8J6QF80_9FLAO|nr:Ig-like domain-containing protein [Aestuariibaculum sediminum]MBD0830949.1 Ig-like domain-containing protein [Aestuariibaculum sediminum]